VRAGCLKPSPDIREPFYYRTSNGSFGAEMFDNERASLSSKVINLNNMHGVFADEKPRTPITTVQCCCAEKESFCKQTNTRGGGVALGGSAA
jgi:hypothetical protein